MKLKITQFCIDDDHLVLKKKIVFQSKDSKDIESA